MLRLERGDLNDVLLKFTQEINEANANGTVDDFARKHGLDISAQEDIGFDKKRAKILIIGELVVDRETLRKVLRQNGIDEERVEVEGEYDDASNYCWEKLRFNRDYSDVIVGPQPHKTTGAGDRSSVISVIESQEGYPNTIRAGLDGELKLTKSSLDAALKKTKFMQFCLG